MELRQQSGNDLGGNVMFNRQSRAITREVEAEEKHRQRFATDSKI